MDIGDKEFEALIGQAMDELPQEYIAGLKNVAITYEDKPSPEQRHKLHLRGNESLYGLYEGLPLTQRGGNYSGAIPDKITIFKFPMLRIVHDMTQLKAQIKNTLWHEIAHYYGLDHKRIRELENRQ